MILIVSVGIVLSLIVFAYVKGLMTKRKSKIDPQLTIAIGLMVVSFSTMFITMYQASIMNRQTEVLLTQTKANAWPCLLIGKTELGSGNSYQIEKYKFTLLNKGTGPAIIEGVRVSYKGQAAKNWDHLVEIMQIPDSISRSRILSQVSKGVISANDEIVMIDYSYNYELINWMKKHGDKILVEVYYKSVFDEIWRIEKQLNSNSSSYPKRVEKCLIPENEQFQN